MSTPVEDLSFKPTGATLKRSLADWSSDTLLNVLNFGADPTGASDSWAAIQGCLDVAFGTYASPHGQNAKLNKPVYFPAGTYKVSKMLIVHWMKGGLVYGAGSNCTKLIYDGPVPAVAGIPAWYAPRLANPSQVIYGPTALFVTNGCGYSNFKGLSLEMPAGYIPTPGTNPSNLTLGHTVCFSMDWYQAGDAGDPLASGNTTYLFEDMKFSSASTGLALGIGTQTDTNVMANCIFDDCDIGVATFNYNALQHKLIGCTITNCRQGINSNAGSFPIHIGTNYSGMTDYDHTITSGDAAVVIGCRTTDADFISLYGPLVAIGCSQVNAGGHFINALEPPTSVVLDICKSNNGSVGGRAPFYIRNTTLGAGALPVSGDPFYGGGLREWMGNQVFTYSDLSTLSTFVAEGCTLNISDATTATWGATVSAGSGSNRVLIRRTGTNATGNIVFSAQPDVASIIRINDVVYVFWDGAVHNGVVWDSTSHDGVLTIDRGANLAAAMTNAALFIEASSVFVSCLVSGGNTLNFTSVTIGAAQNAIGLVAETGSHGTRSAATLLGGTSAWTVVGK